MTRHPSAGGELLRDVGSRFRPGERGSTRDTSLLTASGSSETNTETETTT